MAACSGRSRRGSGTEVAKRTIPAAVLDRAKLVAKEHEPPRRANPEPSPSRLPGQTRAREKVVAALKRLHPMD